MSGTATLQPPDQRDPADPVDPIDPVDRLSDIDPPDDVDRDNGGDDSGDGDGDGQPIRWVTVATFWQPAQAHVARLKLESEDIPCIISDENLVSVYWLYANAIGGVKLQVPEGDVDRARLALGDRAAPADPEFDRPRSEPALRTCPKCGSDEVSANPFVRRLFFGGWLLLLLFMIAISITGAVAIALLVLLWVPFLWLTHEWKCDACGQTWRRWSSAPGFPVVQKPSGEVKQRKDEDPV